MYIIFNVMYFMKLVISSMAGNNFSSYMTKVSSTIDVFYTDIFIDSFMSTYVQHIFYVQ